MGGWRHWSSSGEALALQDVLSETKKQLHVNYSGFRVEPLPDPNGDDKTLSKKTHYVPAHHIRPFVFWQDFMKGIPQAEWHPTILHALKVSSSVSLIEKKHLRGKWPNATIFCRGIYLGAEFLSVGDAVRLMPDNNDKVVTDVVHITAVKYQLSNLDKANGDDNDEGHPYDSTILVTGKGYTMDRSKS